ncbi:MAG: cell division protein FtsZ [Rhodospirillales bacterium]|nr:cell division protein FtsZ [Alphaproteobacteria bacterium]MCB9986995.1 cell division protein FtsZ [Rhodospirillales bacterium]USO08232.1 MAG: cell division protein FtsZ [Rhodospirillales bacterium]
MLNLTASIPDQDRDLSPQITVIGVGGAGCNAVNNMIASKLEGVRFISCNTDAQALKHSLSQTRLQLGSRITSGLGAGSKPEIGRAAAEESIDQIIAEMEGAHMVFITAGMGGGTGTGAAPVIARAAKEAGILTVGVVTKPFHFEGAHRMRMAETGLSEMQQYVDTLIVIPNQNLFRIANEKTTFAEAFKLADSVLQSGVRGVTDLMVMPGLINLDFADVRSAMMEMGKAMMGTGEATGERRAVEAAERAINNPLLDDISMKGAKGVIINITGGYDMTLFEVDEACNRIRDEVDADANIIFGSTFDEGLEGVMRVTVLATGIDTEGARRQRPIRGSNTNAVAPQGVQHATEQRPMPQQGTLSGQPMGMDYSAASAPQGGMYGSASGVQSQLVVPPLTSRVSAPAIAQTPVYAQEGTTMRKIETGGGDMYQQAELGIAPQGAPAGYGAGTYGAGQPTVAASAAEVNRGIRHAGAFIPPRPVDPESARGFGGAQVPAMPSPQRPQMPVFEDDNAFAPDLSARPAGLQLNPPVPGQRSARKPSLFDKIAGMFSEHDDDAGDDQDGGAHGSQGGTAQGGGLFSSFAVRRGGGQAMEAAPMQQVQPQQPIVTPAVQAQPPVQQPQQQAAPGADLDIPAFLRRQVS